MHLLEKYRKIQEKQKAYGYVLNIVGWDSQTEAPKKAFEYRAKMLSVISKDLFQLTTSQDTQDVINGLYNQIDDLEDSVQREIRKAKKQLDKTTKIPENEFVEYQTLLNLSQRVWEEAKESNDWNLFKGNLSKLIDYNKKFNSNYKLEQKIHFLL